MVSRLDVEALDHNLARHTVALGNWVPGMASQLVPALVSPSAVARGNKDRRMEVLACNQTLRMAPQLSTGQASRLSLGMAPGNHRGSKIPAWGTPYKEGLAFQSGGTLALVATWCE